jgi:hypothetical protein
MVLRRVPIPVNDLAFLIVPESEERVDIDLPSATLL